RPPLLVIVPALARLEHDDALLLDAALLARLDEALRCVAHRPSYREGAALAVADGNQVARVEERCGAGGVGRTHLPAKAEKALAADRQQRRVEVRKAGRHVDQLRKEAGVAREVDADAAALDDVAVFGNGVARRDGGDG